MTTMTTPITEHDVRLALPAAQFADALRFVAPAMGDRLTPFLHGVFIKPGPIWAGWDADWNEQWGPEGITVMATDRYRMHVAGIACDLNGLDRTMLLAGTDVMNRNQQIITRGLKPALPKATQKFGNGAVGITAGRLDVTINWPGSSFTVDLVETTMPSINQILAISRYPVDQFDTGFNPKFLAQAVLAFDRKGHHVRVRQAGLKPTAIKSSDPEDTRGVLLMPVRKA
jgi:hypothetical protein